MQDFIYDKILFGNNIKQLLTEKKLKQKHLATATDISQSTISRYIRGLVQPTKINIHAIAHRFNVNIPWLLRGNGPKYAKREKTDSVDYFRQDKKRSLHECFELLSEIQKHDERLFFEIKTHLEGVLKKLTANR